MIKNNIKITKNKKLISKCVMSFILMSSIHLSVTNEASASFWSRLVANIPKVEISIPKFCCFGFLRRFNDPKKKLQKQINKLETKVAKSEIDLVLYESSTQDLRQKLESALNNPGVPTKTQAIVKQLSEVRIKILKANYDREKLKNLKSRLAALSSSNGN